MGVRLGVDLLVGVGGAEGLCSAHVTRTVNDRRRELKLNVRFASKFLFGRERKAAAAVRLH